MKNNVSKVDNHFAEACVVKMIVVMSGEVGNSNERFCKR